MNITAAHTPPFAVAPRLALLIAALLAAMLAMGSVARADTPASQPVVLIG